MSGNTQVMRLSPADARAAVIVPPADGDAIVRNAVALLAEAWFKGTGEVLRESSVPEPGTPAVILHRAEQGGGEGFRLTWDADARTMTVAGQSPNGLLYGVAELLDRMQWTADGLTADLHGYKGHPDASVRAIRGPRPVCSKKEISRVFRELGLLRFNQTSVRAPEFAYEGMPELGMTPDPRIATERQVINGMIDEATQWGVSTFLMMRLIDFPSVFLARYPEAAGQGASLCPLAPATTKLVQEQVAELLAAYPRMAGVRILASEAQSDVFACHCPRCRDHSYSQRLGTLAKAMAEVLGERSIYVMTYLSGWRNVKEPEWYADLEQHLPASARIMVNAMWSDQFITHPPHPLISAYAGDRTVIDVDLWGEYWGWGDIPCCLAEYLAERMNYCYDHGVTSFAGRTDWAFFDSLYDGTLNEVNYHLFARLLWDRRADVRHVVHNWAARRFGETAADAITEIMYLTWEIVTQMMYAGGLLINSHSHPPESLVRFRYLMRDFSAPFFGDGLARSRINSGNVARWMAEKQQCIKVCERALAILQGVAEQLEPRQHRELYTILDGALQTAKVWYHLCDAVWTYELMCREESELARPAMRARILTSIEECERACWHAKRCDPGYAFGIVNELRIALRQPVPPWGGYVPTGRSEDRLQDKIDHSIY